jgi:hypothetical protein
VSNSPSPDINLNISRVKSILQKGRIEVGYLGGCRGGNLYKKLRRYSNNQKYGARKLMFPQANYDITDMYAFSEKIPLYQ